LVKPGRWPEIGKLSANTFKVYFSKNANAKKISEVETKVVTISDEIIAQLNGKKSVHIAPFDGSKIRYRINQHEYYIDLDEA
jgi:hypothetical protein